MTSHTFQRWAPAVAIAVIVGLGLGVGALEVAKVNSGVNAIVNHQKANAEKLDETKVAAENAKRGVVATRANTHLIEDCLQPTGACAQRLAAQAAERTKEQNNLGIYRGICIRRVPLSVPAVRQCVAALALKYGD